MRRHRSRMLRRVPKKSSRRAPVFASQHPICAKTRAAPTVAAAPGDRVADDSVGNETGRSRGFGFVEMSSAAEAQAAITAFDGKEVGGRNLKVNEAKARENGGGGRSRCGNYGGRGRW